MHFGFKSLLDAMHFIEHWAVWALYLNTLFTLASWVTTFNDAGVQHTV